MFVDSHCHLDRLKIANYEGALDEALNQARECKVQNFLCISVSLENIDHVIDIANRYEDVFASVGVHPLDVDSGMPVVSELSEKGRQPKVIAIGETGLDYYYSEENKDQQKESFSRQIQVSTALKKPLVIHTRSAKEDTLTIIKQQVDPDVAGVLHCFTEDWDMAKKAIDMNFYISISGIVTFKNAKELQETVKKIPLDRLLIETDSPYLAPVPFRGKSNQPKYVPEVAKCIAELKNLSVESLAEATTENFFSLFKHASA